MKRGIFMTIAMLAFAASITMYLVGKSSSHLSELYDVFWLPLPVGFLFLIGALMTKK